MPLDHGYIASKTHDFEDLVSGRSYHLRFVPHGPARVVLTYGHLLKEAALIFTDVGRKDRSGGAHSGMCRPGVEFIAMPPHGGP